MSFSLSPGIAVVEKDFSSIVPAVSTSAGAFCGPFSWGPIEEPNIISSENNLVSFYGGPTDSNFQSFFSAANFLAYSNNLLTIRTDADNLKNAVESPIGSLVSATVTNSGTGFTDIPTITITPSTGNPVATATLKALATSVVNTSGNSWAVGDKFTINIGSGREATFTVATIDVDGKVLTFSIADAGSYTDIISASLTGVTATKISGSGNGTSLTIDVVLGINTVTVSGGDYAVAPTLAADPINGSVIATPVIQPRGVKIKNVEEYESTYIDGDNGFGLFAAKYAGKKGNDLRVVLFDKGSYDFVKSAADVNPPTEESKKAQILLDFYISLFGLTGDLGNSANWTSDFAAARGISNDEVHVVVFDARAGTFSGIVDVSHSVVVEKYIGLSKLTDAKSSNGTDNFYKTAINTQSSLLWWLDHPSAADIEDESTNDAWGLSSETILADPTASKIFTSLVAPKDITLTGGVDDFNSTDGQIQDAYSILTNADTYDIALVVTGNVSAPVAQHIIDNLVEVRRDCIAFISPNDNGQPIIGSGSVSLQKVLTYRNTTLNRSTSYAVLDSGFKYQYDRYNDKYRWIPLNGDIAGLCARTDSVADPWWSPGGFNRGQIKNVIKLAFNPGQTERDKLYPAGVNPVVSFPGQGVVLYGDKTLLAKPSAFDRINVRRLFIVLEKAITIAAKFSQLFEFNDEFSRAQFKNMVEPYLRDIQGRRGLIDFRVVCDESNNTSEVIDRNEFVASILLKPARSINFVILNFAAVRTSVSFEEIGA